MTATLAQQPPPAAKLAVNDQAVRPVVCPAVETRFANTATRRTDALYDATLLQDLQRCAVQLDTDEDRLALAIDSLVFAIILRNDVVASHTTIPAPHPLSEANGRAVLDWADALVKGIDWDQLEPSPDLAARFFHNISRIAVEDARPLRLREPFISFAQARHMAANPSVEAQRVQLRRVLDDAFE